MAKSFPSIRVGVGLALSALVAPAQESLVRATPCLAVVYEESCTKRMDSDGPGPSPTTSEKSDTKLTLTLGPRRIALQSGDVMTTWDFAAGLTRRIDRTAGTYTELSILHEVAFVESEMQNRKGLKGVLAAAKIEGGDEWSPFDLSVLFCWPVKDDAAALAHSESDGTVSFTRDGNSVSSWRLSASTLDESQRAMFARLLQRRAHLHPKVIAALVGSGHLPSELTFHWRDAGMRASTTWRLLAVSTVGEWSDGIAGMRRTFGDGVLGQLARMVHAPASEGVPVRLSADRFRELAEVARGQQRFVDSAMLLLESSLSNGEVPQMQELRQNTEAMKEITAFMKPITLANSDSKQALALFAELDRSALSRPQLLDVFRANALRPSSPREALELLLATLQASPWIAMAYKDLGDLYHGSFDMVRAWTAWELGRRITPGHSCWKALEKYEQRLRRDFAERL